MKHNLKLAHILAAFNSEQKKMKEFAALLC